MKQETQQEAKERAACHRAKHLFVNQITTKTTSTFPTPTLLVGVESNNNHYTALLDLGVDTNVMPKSIYDKLHNKQLQVDDE